MRITVLGADGQLGTDVLDLLSKDLPVNGLTREDFDATDRDVFRQLRPLLENSDIVINCVAYTDVDRAEEEEALAYRLNAEFPKGLAKILGSSNKLLFHISTDYVFSGRLGRPYREDDTPDPINVYGKTKLAGERAVLSLCPRHFIFRTAGLFGKAGPSGKSGNFIDTIIKLARERALLKVVDDQLTSPTHTLDVARAIKVFIEKGVGEYGIFNVVSSGYCSWYKLANYIVQRLGIETQVVPVSSDEFPRPAARPKFSALDNSKVSKWYNMPYWQDAVEEYLRIKMLLPKGER